MLKVVVLEEENNSEKLIKDLSDMGIKIIRCGKAEIQDVYKDNCHEVLVINKEHYEVVDDLIEDDLDKELSIINSNDASPYNKGVTNLTDYVLSELDYIRSMENERRLVYKY